MQLWSMPVRAASSRLSQLDPGRRTSRARHRTCRHRGPVPGDASPPRRPHRIAGGPSTTSPQPSSRRRPYPEPPLVQVGQEHVVAGGIEQHRADFEPLQARAVQQQHCDRALGRFEASSAQGAGGGGNEREDAVSGS